MLRRVGITDPQAVQRQDLARLTARLVCEELPDPDGPISAEQLSAMVGRAWMMGAAVYENIACGRRTCRICGCTHARACDPPCSWAEADLCTACVRN